MKTESTSYVWTKQLGTAALGALAMYFSDPSQGRRRRALARNKLQSAATKTNDALNVAGRDLSNRLAGIQARMHHLTGQHGKMPDDQVLAERVRTCLGRAASHPRAISVTARGGQITLSGPVLSIERQHLLDSVKAVAGVAGVDDKLEIHTQPDGIAALQGKGRPVQLRNNVMRENWTPALRAVAVAGGAVLGSYGLARRTPAGAALAVVGLALLARGAGNIPLARMLGLGSEAQGIRLEKTIDINLPIDTVFDVWTQYHNFPYFMSHVQEVRELGPQRSHWVVKGPAGTRLEWDAVLTNFERPSLMSWKTEPGARVEHAGSVFFEPAGGGTRVTVRMSYSPPAGTLGHALATLLGSDPKQELDDDLLRMKAFIESGTLPHDAAKPMVAPGRQPQGTIY